MGKEIQAVFFDMGGTIETFNYTRELRLEATAVIQQRLFQAGINLQLGTEQLLEVISSGLGRYKLSSIQSMDELPPQRVWSEYVFSGYEIDQSKLADIAEELSFFVETRFYQRAMRPEIPDSVGRYQTNGAEDRAYQQCQQPWTGAHEFERIWHLPVFRPNRFIQ